jgi:hypothetical protein
MTVELDRIVERVERDAWIDLYEAAPAGFAAALGLRGGAALLMLRQVPETQFNRALGLGLDAPVADGDLAAIDAAYRGQGCVRWFLQPVPAADGADFAARAARLGYSRYARDWVKLARGDAAPLAVDTGLAIAEAGAGEAEAVAAVVSAGFGVPPAFGAWFAALVGRPNWRFYLARRDGQAVATAGLYLAAEAGWLGIAATRPEARNLGGQGALMARRIADGIAAGRRILVTETGAPVAGQPQPSYNNMRRHGFTLVHERANYLGTAG